MSSVVTTKNGVLSSANGEITLTLNGQSKNILPGEQIPAGAELQFASDLAFVVTFDDGTVLNGDELIAEQVDASVTDDAVAQFSTDMSPEELAEIEALQALILSGEDPTEELPETAAGEASGNEGGSDFASLARDGAETIAIAGFDTSFDAPETLTANLSLGDEGVNALNNNNFNVAQFTDNFVNGVSFTTSSGLSGFTGDFGAPGSFAYLPGDTITFMVGGVTIATFSADVIQGDILFLQDIAGTLLSDTNMDYVENMAIFLQALDNDLSDGVDDGVLNTNSLVNIEDSYATNINILLSVHEALANYIDPTTGQPLNIATAGKEMISQVLAELGIIFTRDTERQENEQNLFETIAMEHVAGTIDELAGDRAPDEHDARTVDVLDVPGGLVTYNYNELDGQITFSVNDLLEGAVGQQVVDQNLLVTNVRLSAAFENIGTLQDLGDGNYAIILNEGIDQYDLEGLSIDYRVEDWTVFKDVTSSTQDQYKSHLSADIPDVLEDVGFNQFTLNSELTFEDDQALSITFTSELLSEQLGYPIAEYADDYLVPLEYSNDGGLTWQTMTVTGIDTSGDLARPIFGFTLAAGSDSVMIRVPIFDDAIIEPTEYFNAIVSGENVYDEELEFAIIDNDGEGSDLPVVDIDYAVVVEGMEFALFTLTLSEPSTETITLDYSSEELTALFGEDFTNVSGTVTFLPGETTAYITVPITDDLIVEDSPEFALINLSNVTNAVLGDTQATLRIYDNDSPDNTAIILDIDPVTGDNVLTPDESTGTVTITGTVTADASITTGIIMLTINGQEYQAIMQSDGTFSVEVDAQDLLNDPDTVIDGIVYGYGDNGAKGTATSTEDYDIPTEVVNDSIIIAEDTVAEGNVLDNDSDTDDALTVVSFEVNGQTYSAGDSVTLDEGVLTLNEDGSYTFTPNTDWNGQVPVITYTTNTNVTATLTIEVTPVADGAPGVIINTDANNDGIISEDELAGNTEVSVTIDLTTTGAQPGDTLVVNGQEIILTQEDIDNGSVDLTLPAPQEGDTIEVVATVIDSAGNISPEGSDSATLDTTAPVISVVAPDNSNDYTPLISGTTDAEPGSTVTLVVTDSEGNEQILEAIVSEDGSFEVEVNDPLAEGDYTVVAEVTDPAGNTATDNDNGSVDTTAPTITVSAPDSNLDSTPTITGTTDAAPGSTVIITVVDAEGNEQTLEAIVNPDGSYEVDVVEPLVEGDYTVNAAVTDPSGNTATANDEGAIDTVAPEITVNAPDNSSDSTPIITGTTDVEPGTTVTIIVTDSEGTEQIIEAVVSPDGTYEVEVPEPLAEGDYTAVAGVSDPAGNGAMAEDTGDVDTTAPTITVAAPEGTGDNTPLIIGSTDAAPGSTVTLTVTDSEGNEQTLEAEVNPDGTYQVEVPSPLSEGDYTVTASVTDAAGNTATANDNGEIDAVAGQLTVDLVIDGDNNGDITGTSQDIPAGGTVTLVITDIAGTAITITDVAVNADGTYSVDNVDLSTLVDGDITVVATATDSNGNDLSANDTENLDALSSNITVDLVIDGDNNGDITGTSQDIPAGGTVTLVITDIAGTEITITDVAVNADGTYSVDNVDLSTLVDGDITVVATATDSNGNNLSANDTENLDAVDAQLTVDLVIDGDNNGDITGTSQDIPAGGTVTLVITDIAGTEITIENVVVNADGTYSVDNVDLSTLVDGDITVVATATDSNGNDLSANDTENLDAVDAELTVDLVIDASNQGDITGTSQDIPAGGTVTLVITDIAGTEITITDVTVNADGTYSVDNVDLSTLVDGDITVVATATDSNGNDLSANDTENLDAVDAELTVDLVIDASNQGDITGNSQDIPAGGTVTLVITDIAGTAITITDVAVNADGTYSVDNVDLSTLVDGDITVVATATDSNGNDLSANDIENLDAVDAELTVDLVIDASNQGDITGTSQDIPAGGTVTLVITDIAGTEITITDVAVNADGTYSVDNVDLSTLVDGDITVVATATDSNGNDLSANDTENLDAVDAQLTVDLVIDGDNNGDITGTSQDIPAGGTVTLVITDIAGTEITITDVAVNADGTYSVDNVDLSTLVDGDITVVATATDSNGNDLSANDIENLDAVDAELTVDLVIDASNQGDITGTSQDIPAGGTVTLVITDIAGTEITITDVAVNADGTYSVDNVDLSTLVDGDITVVATATDSNGNDLSANDIENLDAVDAELTVDLVIDASNQGDITGTSQDIPAGGTVTLVITDIAGTEITITDVAVNADGTYSVDNVDLSTLVDGDITVVATATDSNGNDLSANDTENLDAVDAQLTVDLVIDGDNNGDITGTSQDIPAGGTVTLVITDIAGTAITITDVAVNADGTYSVDNVDLSTLVDGDITVVATATDSNGNDLSANDTENLDAVDAQLTVDLVIDGDNNGDITGTSQDIPAGGTVTLVITDIAGTAITITDVAVNADGTYSVDNVDLSTLVDGDITVVATATDSNGNDLSANDTENLDAVDAELTVDLVIDASNQGDITGTSQDIPAGGTVTLVITDIAGTEITITDVAVNADGTYSVDNVDLSTLVDGDITVVATATDSNGNDLSANDTENLDAVDAELTVDLVIDASNQGDITGTSQDIPAGGTVTLVITDIAGTEITIENVVVAADGTYSVDNVDLSTLVDGDITVVATATDSNGNDLSANDTENLDAVDAELTVDLVVDASNQGDITGTSQDIPAGGTVTLVITDIAGTAITITDVAVNADGTYSVDNVDLSTLVDGDITVVATATDSNGNDLSANDTENLDAVDAELTVDLVIDASNQGDITGTSQDIPAGGTVTLVITDIAGTEITITDVAVNADGTYSVDNVDLSTLVDGDITVVATATDSNGNDLSANDTENLDAVDAELTVDLVIDASNQGDITGTSQDIPAGGTVTLVITDIAGTAITITDVAVNADGTYSVDNVDLSTLVDGDITVVATATDSNGNDLSANDTENLDAVDAQLTVDLVIDASNQGDITGTSQDIPAGGTVTLVITDIAGTEITITDVAVNADGTYSVDNVDLSTLVDGDITVVATATDSNGNDLSANDTENLDAVDAQLTVDLVIDGDNNGDITGTSQDIPAGGTVTLVITDIAGTAITITDVAVNADGTYSVDNVDLSTLVDGDITVVATATDSNGNDLSANDTENLDAVDAELTVDLVIDASNQGDITGTSQDIPAGGTVTLVITDIAGTEITITDVAVNADGTYSVDNVDLSTLVDGDITVVATATDSNGNDLSANDTENLDAVDAQLTVDLVIDGDNNGDITGTSLDIPAGGTVTLVITDIAGTAITITDVAVNADGTYSVDNVDLSTLVDGDITVVATATDSNGNDLSANDTENLDAVDAQLTVDLVIDGDNNGDITGTSQDIPAGGTVTLVITDIAGTEITITDVAVNADGTYSVDNVDLSTLVDGDITVVATATDSNGNDLSANDTENLDAVDAELTVDLVIDASNQGDITGTSQDIPAGGTVTLVITDIAGTTITITDVAVNADGTYSVDNVDLSTLVDGDITVVATATDSNGNDLSANDTENLDAVDAELTVDLVIDASNQGDIAGTSQDIPAGGTVTLVITDIAGTTITITDVAVNADGTYSVDNVDLSTLVDGDITVVATATDSNGNDLSANDTENLDAVDAELTVDLVIDASNQGDITGTSQDIPAGGTVTLVITDIAGTEITIENVAVAADGTYSVDDVDLSTLVDGDITVVATATDSNGNDLSANDTENLDALSSNITVDLVIDGDNNGDITGTSLDIPAGGTVTLVITDIAGTAITITDVAVNADGTYSVDNVDLSTLVDGDITVVATATDSNGNDLSANDTENLDAVDAQLTVDLVIDGDNNGDISGTSQDIPAGGTVTLVITDIAGTEITIENVAVAADGTYSVDDVDLSTLVDGDITVVATATDSNGNDLSANDTENLDAVDAELTVDLVIDASNQGDITGTSQDIPAGGTVTLVITDIAGTEITITDVAVNADGTYSVDNVDLSTLVDGDITVVATATDSNGNDLSANDTENLDAVDAELTVDLVIDASNQGDITGTSQDIPAGGTVTLVITDIAGTTITITDVAVNADGTYSVDNVDLSTLVDGDITVVATATDSNGNDLSANDTENLDAVDAELTVDLVIDASNQGDITGTSQDIPAGGTVTLVITDIAGTEITITDVAVNADGTYSVDNVDLSTLVDGDITVVATATDSNGNDLSANDTENLDAVDAELTVDLVIDASNQGDITGTSQDIPAGGTVTLVITDIAGTTITITDVAVNADGTYSVDNVDLSTLVDGDITVVATATDSNGNDLSANDTENLDAVDAELTVDLVIDASNQGDITGTSQDIPAGGTVTLVITDIAGTTITITDVAVNADGTYSVDNVDLSTLVDGDITVVATATDSNGNDLSANDTENLDAVDAQLTVDLVIDGDNSGDITGTSQDIPAGGTVTLVITDIAGTAITITDVAVNADGTYSVDNVDLSTLVDGDITVVATATDSNGNDLSANDTENLDAVDAQLTVDLVIDASNQGDITGTSQDIPAGGTVTLVITDIAGTEITITDVAVNADGTYSVDNVDLSTLVDGDITVVATATDSNGNDLSANDTENLDAVDAELTVDLVIDASNQGDITGTSQDIPAGGTVTLVITDIAGTAITITDVAVNADGTYSVDNVDLSTLVDGDITVVATATDSNGNDLSANDTENLDAVDAELTVDLVIDASNQGDITGTSQDIPAGGTVTLVITDIAGTEITITDVAVNADGTYSVDNVDLSTLVDGDITVVATATDSNGNDLSANDTENLDAVDAQLTVDLVIDGDNNGDITGTSLDIPAGGTVTLVITDIAGTAITITDVAVNADGTYSVDNVDLSTLVDGDITVVATATDSNGNDLSANDTENLDAVDAQLTVDLVIDGDNNGDITGTSQDIPAGGTVTLVITDIAGTEITITDVAVNADGTYSVDNVDLSTLVDGDITVVATATDSNGNDLSANDTENLDAVDAQLTVDLVIDGDNNGDITGTSLDIPAGGTVTLVITDIAGTEITITDVAVNADGTYSVDNVDLSTLVDGDITVVATATDSNGNDLSANDTENLDAVDAELTVDLVIDASNQGDITGTSQDIPAGGTVTLVITDIAGTEITITDVAVNADGTYSVDNVDLSTLVDGDITVVATATDSNGNDLSANDTENLDAVDAELTVDLVIDASNQGDITGTSQDIPAGGTVTLVITDIAGTTITITDVAVNADGTYSVDNVDLSTLVDGDITVVATATDSNGNDLSANDTENLDAVDAELTVDLVIDASNQGDITGTSQDIPAGGTVTLVITDIAGTTITITDVAVNADGTYSVDNVDLSTLVDGDITVVATATDSNGNDLSANDTENLDAVDAELTVDLVIDASNQGDITGTSQDIPAGGTVTLVITDIAGTEITITDVAVNADGTYSVDNVDLSTLVDGDITVVATATDSNGNDLSANDTENLDAVDAELTVDLVIDASNQGDITGTSQDIPAGGTVTLVITDIAGTTITITDVAVNADGTYSVDNVDLSTLVDGDITVVATATDSNGNDLSANDTENLDAVDAELTVDLVIDASNQGDITGTSQDIPAGGTVTLVITDIAGTTITITDVAVNADGTYSVDNVDLSTLVDGDITVVATATDSNGNDLSANDTENLDAVDAQLTVDLVIDGDNNGDISGTSQDIPAGGTVTLVITDIAGTEITIENVAVGADGTYSVDNVDLSTLVDGDITVVATATDSNGNDLSANDTENLDAVDAQLTVDLVIDGDNNGDITGTSQDIPAGGTVTLVITDIAGTEITITDVAVNADGTYSVDNVDLSTLVDGDITVVATATDSNGNDLSANDTENLDAVDAQLTVDLVIDGDNNGDISGTSQDIPAGGTVTLVITDIAGTEITIENVAVGADGTYSVDNVDLSTLVDGDITVVATATDSNGNDLSANDTENLDAVDAELTVDLVIDASNQGDITGTSQDIPAGGTVTLVITDIAGTEITIENVAVAADGTYSVDNVDLSTLVDGDIRVVATATDSNGNDLSANDTEKLDATAPTLDITVADSTLDFGEATLVTFTFSEAITNFNLADDIIVSGGTLTGLISIDGGETWTATFTPTDGYSGPASITVNDDTYTDLAGNLGSGDSENLTVADNSVDAVDDLAGSIFTTTADSANNWVSPTNGDGEADFVISARNADGSIGTVSSGENNLLGVAGSPRASGQIASQIEYDSATGTSEAIVIDFNGLVNEATFSVSHMYANENSGEQGTWYAYYNGQLVASETFTTATGTTGTFTINTGNQVFDQLVFEAAPTISEASGGVALEDSSDYYLDSVTVTGPALVDAYVVQEDSTLEITDIAEGLFANDTDAQNHDFDITHINGSTYTYGQLVTLASGATIIINDDGTYTYDVNGAFDNLTAGELDTDTFTYTLTDEYGAVDTATVTINIVGVNLAPEPSADQLTVVEGESIVFDALDLITNDSDPENESLTVTRFAPSNSDTNSIDATQAGQSFTTTLGGTITINNDGSYSYTAPLSLDHSSNDTLVDSFYYQVNDGTSNSTWTQVLIDVNDTAPIAEDDTDNVGFGGLAFGDVITGVGTDGSGVDSIAADTTQLTSVTFDNVTYDSFDADGNLTITTDKGILTINQDGSYQYQSTQTDTTINTHTYSDLVSNNDVSLYGFASGVSFDLNNLGTPGANVGNNGNNRIGVGNSSDANIRNGEQLVIDLGTEAPFNDLEVALRNVAGSEEVNWAVYDENGVLVDSGTGTSNSLDISTSLPFQYLVITAPSGSNFSLNSITASAIGNGIVGAEEFSYELTDSDGDTTNAILTIDQDSTPIATNNAFSVSESGLVGGTQESSDSHISIGNILDNDSGISSTTVITELGGVTPVNGVITITTANGILTVYTDDSNGFRTGDYQYELTTTNSTSESVLENYSYTIENGVGATSSANLEITIIDDAPVVEDITQNLQTNAETLSTNLTFILDVSGSMNNSAGNGKTYLETAIESLTALINEVDASGNVNIQIVTYSGSATNSSWIIDDIDAAIAYLNSLQAGGGTNYEAALQNVISSGTIPDADNSFVYFISDGVPSSGNEVDATLQGQWQTYLDSNYDISFGIGIGNASLDAILPISYPEADDGSEEYAIIVNNADDLTNTILDFFDSNTVVGNLGIISNSASGVLVGADGGNVASVVIDGVTYTYDALNPTQVITTNLGATFNINFETGEYEYLLDASANVLNEQESIDVTIVDNDGDSASLVLQINLDYYASLDANVNNVITNQAQGDLTISTEYLTHGDALPDNGSLSSVTSGSAGNTALANDIVTVTNANDGDSFEYTLSANGTTDTAEVTIDYQNSDVLIGTHENDIIIASSTASNTATATDIKATVKSGNTYNASNQFGFEAALLAAGISITRIDINLRAGGDTDAIVDVSQSSLVKGSDSVGIDDSDANIFANMTADNGILTAVFSAGDFTNGDEFWFAFDTDFLGGDTGGDLVGATFTITLSDGTVQTGTYISDGANGATGNIYFADAILDGGAGDDVLIGGDGNEILIGGLGDDLLSGGLGDDVLTGGEGSNTFVWNANEIGTDTITDFDTSKDSLDLRDLLVNEDLSSLDSMLNFSSDGTNTTIDIDADNNGVFEQHIVLDGVDLTDVYSSTDDGEIINGLLDDGALIVDTSDNAPAQNAAAIDPLENNLDGNIIP
ncbi:Ig-like domain-containing protein [Shewanella sp. ENK2]|uniref:Ig-like domain-containing protein n=1 Tax=Shewanella sp. ENK2 TaxID=2775245 RepID=UPI0037478A10